LLLTIIPQPTIIAFSSASICIGETKNIYAEGGDTYNWLPIAGVSNPTAFSTFVKPSITTIYTVTASNGGLCSGTATVQIVVNPLPVVYAGVDTTINMDESYVLHGTGNVTVGFLSPNGIPLICNYCPVVEVNPKQTTCYTLKGENEFGCVAYDEVCINVTKDWNVYIPNAFSPNDDSDNDVFIPVGYGLSDIKLYIFDRWGELIFMSNNRIIGWDGTLKDKKCQQDVYVYKAEIKTITGIKLFRTGHVTLLSNIK
jgi:gliding motility-associated-like protein